MCLPSLIWEQGFSYICSAPRWSWREFWSVPWHRQCGLMAGIKVMKSLCSWRCTQMDGGECWDPKVWGTGGALHQLWSRFRASVCWGKERSCIFSIALTTGSLVSSSSVIVLWQEWAACPSHCCVPTWHPRHVGALRLRAQRWPGNQDRSCRCWGHLLALADTVPLI